MPGWFPPVVFDFGADCLTCYAAGLTPLHYYVSFVGIMRGDNWNPIDGQPPNNLYDITQVGGAPCRWNFIVPGGERIEYSARVADTILTNVFRFPLLAFTSTNLDLCSRWHFNDRAVPAHNHFYGGYAIVFTPEEIQAIIEKVTPVVDPDPLFRVGPVAAQKLVISYIDSWGDTKIKMLVDSL